MAPRLNSLKVDKVCEGVSNTAKTYLLKLCDVWEMLGLDDESVEERFSTVESHTKTLFEEMVREELDLAEKLRKKIDNLTQQLNTINIDLDMSASCNTEGLALMPTKAKLEECLSSLRVKHQERLEERSLLEKQEKVLCQQLGEEQFLRPEKKALADEALSQLRSHIKTLQSSKEKLIATLNADKAAIVKLYAELEAQPSTSFEQSVVTANTAQFSLTPASMASVKDLKCKLENDLKQVHLEVERLRERVSQLWERLEVDAFDRECFLENFPGHSRRTREALNEEIQRCEELKHQNIERFIDRMRNELRELWEKCCVSEEEQAAFEPFYSSDFSDELLDAHEAEVRRLETYFTANRPIFELLGRRAELWERMAVLEAKAHDKDRLFQNRGGQLLKEEKERKQLQKELPHVENELKRMIQSWEEKSGEPFLLRGRRAVEVLEEQWDNRKMDKEREKQERKQAQQKQLEREAVMGTTMFTGAVKRKLMADTPELQRKMPRITPAKPPGSKMPASSVKIVRPVQRRGITSATRTAQTRAQIHAPDPSKVAFTFNINVVERNQTAHNMETSLASSISYRDFSQHLEARATRSSAAPPGVQLKTMRSVLTPANTPAKTTNMNASRRYPHSAPAKPPRQLRSTPKSQTPLTAIKRTPLTTTKLTRTRNNLPIIF